MNALVNFLLQQVANNPRIQNNPNAQQWLQVIQSGNAQAGEQIARNIAQSYGMSPEQATKQAESGFMGMFGRR